VRTAIESVGALVAGNCPLICQYQKSGVFLEIVGGDSINQQGTGRSSSVASALRARIIRKSFLSGRLFDKSDVIRGKRY
jgi:hypothetical protein